ncbi:hypothetical protein A3Q34_06100 [Colwellia sp. PAMC 20917]|uniref:oligosaccharide flippase family protein n=1 Tax=Colwellia sp. PAMC 20917 TaxID=1816218 RepID=UPI0008786D16|nr:oligosaccharide flippase family protein [Colwellia sp. PAMC 20917]AOW76467.1 hypothetical protein A3Q34_06100 [Colwellia sp. PAMC 20917]
MFLKRIIQNTSVYLFGSVISQLFNLIFVIVLMGYLTIEQYGQYSLVIAFVALFAFIVDGGMTGYIIKEYNSKNLKNNLSSAKKFYGAVLGYQISLSIVLASTFLFTTYFYNKNDILTSLIVFGLGTIFSGLFSPLYALLIAQERKGVIFIKDITNSIIRLLFLLLILYSDSPSFIIYLAPYLALLVGFSICAYVYQNNIINFCFYFFFDFKELYRILKVTMPFLLLSIANIIFNKIDVIMIGELSSIEEVAIYSGATTFIYPFMFISSALVMAVFPMLTNNSNQKESFLSIQRTSMIILSTAGILLSIVLYLLAPFLYNELYEGKYLASKNVFNILVWYLAIVFSYGVINNAIVAKNKINFLIFLNIIMIIINILSNWFLIPTMGARGAAFSTIFCELIVFITVTIYYYLSIKPTFNTEENNAYNSSSPI